MRYGKALWVLGSLPLASANPPQYRNGSSRGTPYAVGAVTSKQYHSPIPGCRDCCTSTLLATTYHTTFYETETMRITVTQHDVSTKLEYTTDLVTKTTVSTFMTSFPVIVTTTNNCVPKSVNGAWPTPVKNGGYGYRRPNVGDSQYCGTITTTEWKTMTTTEAFTIVQPSVTTKMVLVPTTIEDTRTVTQVQTSLRTIWLSTTYTESTTYSKEYPVTVTSGQTVIETTTRTEYITAVSTMTSSYPVVTEVTEVTKLVTQTATVTAPGQATTSTVTAPGKVTTLTLPAETRTLPKQTVTLPGSTTVTTLTRELPATTITVTENGQTVTSTLPGATVTLRGETITIPEKTKTLPAETAVLPCSLSVSTLTRELPGTTVTVVEGGTTFTVSVPGEAKTLPGPTVVSTLTQVLPGETFTVTQSGRVVTTSLPGQTLVSTITNQLPAGTVTVTQDGRTFTVFRPGETRTLPASTVVATITQVLPGQTITVTQGGSTLIKTLPGETAVSTVTEELPGQIVTLTESGKTLTTTLPGKTATLTQDATTIRTTLPGTTAVISTTIVLAPSGVPAPSGTTVSKEVQEISVCPSPTGSSAPLSPKSNLTFGCKPGYVCSPPKPNGCNVWPGPPSEDFLCRPQDCIPSPAIQNVTWEDGETSYYPLSEGFFNLNPEAFGLSYDIFTFRVHEKVEYGHTRTITTGNWESQTSLSDWPRTTATSKRTKKVYSLPPSPRRRRRAHDRLGKRATTPSVCYDQCEGAWQIVGSVGKREEICIEGSSFQNSHDACAKCIEANSEATKDTIRAYVEPIFRQFTDWCSGHETQPIRSTTAPVAESIVTAQPSLRINSQAETSQASFVPIEAGSSQPADASSLSATSMAAVTMATSLVADTSEASSAAEATTTVEVTKAAVAATQSETTEESPLPLSQDAASTAVQSSGQQGDSSTVVVPAGGLSTIQSILDQDQRQTGSMTSPASASATIDRGNLRAGLSTNHATETAIDTLSNEQHTGSPPSSGPSAAGAGSRPSSLASSFYPLDISRSSGYVTAATSPSASGGGGNASRDDEGAARKTSDGTMSTQRSAGGESRKSSKTPTTSGSPASGSDSSPTLSQPAAVTGAAARFDAMSAAMAAMLSVLMVLAF